MNSPAKSVELRRAERELFFWTARQMLKLIALAAMTIYFVVSLIQGEPAGLRDAVDFITKVVEQFRR